MFVITSGRGPRMIIAGTGSSVLCLLHMKPPAARAAAPHARLNLTTRACLNLEELARCKER